MRTHLRFPLACSGTRSVLTVLLTAILWLGAGSPAAARDVVPQPGGSYGLTLAGTEVGHPTLAWSTYRNGAPLGQTDDLWVSRLSAAADIATPEALPIDPNAHVLLGDLAVGSDGTATAVWTEVPLFGDLVVKAARVAPDGAVTALQDLGPGEDPQVVLDRRGRATIAWVRQEPSARKIVAARVSADGNLGGVHEVGEIAPYTDFDDFTLVADGAGQSVIASASRRAIKLTRIANGPAPRPLGSTKIRGQAYDLSFATSPKGALAWRGKHNGHYGIFAASIKRDLTNRGVRRLTGEKPGRLFSPSVVGSPFGPLTVVWATRKRDFAVLAASLDQRGRATPTRTIAHDARGPAIAADNRGRPVVAWLIKRNARPGSAAGIGVAHLTAAGPRMQRLDTGPVAPGLELGVEAGGRALLAWRTSRGADVAAATVDLSGG